METLNGIAQTASNAIFGTQDQNKQEPISGVKGDTAHGEPYDAGNMDPPPSSSKEDTTASPTETPATNPAETNPSSSHDIKDSSKGQADTRHPSNPEAAHGTSTEKNDVDNTKDDKPDVKGPGPRPLEVVAKEHGGDAGSSNESLDKTPSGEHKAAGQVIKPMVEPSHHPSGGSGTGGRSGAAGEDGDGPQNESHGKGTGEKWQRSTGLAAEGGNFDATRPGAGREADRILEEMGIRKPDSHEKAAGSETSLGSKGGKHEDPPAAATEKKSLKDKIKEKLHKH